MKMLMLWKGKFQLIEDVCKDPDYVVMKQRLREADEALVAATQKFYRDNRYGTQSGNGSGRSV